MGYPLELLTKSKSLLYRYTVYTPQEEMKAILSERSEVRLDTLRKVFAIDKYKRIRENTTMYARTLRERKRMCEGFIADLPEKQDLKKEYLDKLASIEEQIKKQKPRVDEARHKVQHQRNMLEQHEQQMQELVELKKQSEVLGAEVKIKTEQQQRYNNEIKALQQRTQRLQDEVALQTVRDPQLIQQDIATQQQQTDALEQQHRGFIATIAALQAEQKVSETTKEKITSLEQCPTCLQQVTSDHKHTIISKEDEKITALLHQVQQHNATAQDLIKKITKNKASLDELRKHQQQATTVQHKKQLLAEYAERVTATTKLQQEIQHRLAHIQTTQQELQQKITQRAPLEQEYAVAKKELDAFLDEQKRAEILFAQHVKEKEGVVRHIELLQEEIEKKLLEQKKLARLNELAQWLSEFFTSLMSVMEKHVMSRIYHEFNSLFQKWFAILVEEDIITARLDEQFSPVINQNGHDILVDYLSGGEKTACALAYRLALNRVINEVVHTSNLLILDEPTDGFSNEQLDRMRDVLEQLPTQQIIIVSHEHKIESFVDHVIKITKHEHESSIA